MKIDTSSPRIPLHLLKHPVKEKLHLPQGEADVDAEVGTQFSETFERKLLEKGAKKFKAWLEKFDIK